MMERKVSLFVFLLLNTVNVSDVSKKVDDMDNVNYTLYRFNLKSIIIKWENFIVKNSIYLYREIKNKDILNERKTTDNANFMINV